MLERMDIDWDWEQMKYEDDGDYVRWSEELQEAWDKQQEKKLINNDYCPVCEINVNCYEFAKYCSNCGQKIKR